MVCSTCFDTRHPQDMIRPVPEKIGITDPRPEQTDRFLAVGEVTADDL